MSIQKNGVLGSRAQGHVRCFQLPTVLLPRLRLLSKIYFGHLVYNLIAIPIEVAGRLNPMIASAAMALSSVSVYFEFIVFE